MSEPFTMTPNELAELENNLMTQAFALQDAQAEANHRAKNISDYAREAFANMADRHRYKRIPRNESMVQILERNIKDAEPDSDSAVFLSHLKELYEQEIEAQRAGKQDD